jgi:hypothetical protein
MCDNFHTASKDLGQISDTSPPVFLSSLSNFSYCMSPRSMKSLKKQQPETSKERANMPVSYEHRGNMFMCPASKILVWLGKAGRSERPTTRDTPPPPPPPPKPCWLSSSSCYCKQQCYSNHGQNPTLRYLEGSSRELFCFKQHLSWKCEPLLQ